MSALRDWQLALSGERFDKREGESATQRLTRRNNELLDGGTHPATRRPLFIGTGEQCGGCQFHHAYRYHNKTFHKCEMHRLGESHSAASDVRVSWPACVLFEPKVS